MTKNERGEKNWTRRIGNGLFSFRWSDAIWICALILYNFQIMRYVVAVLQEMHRKEYDAQMRASCSLSISSQVSHLFAARPARILFVGIQIMPLTVQTGEHFVQTLRVNHSSGPTWWKDNQYPNEPTSWKNHISVNLPLITAIMWRSSESVNISRLSASW